MTRYAYLSHGEPHTYFRLTNIDMGTRILMTHVVDQTSPREGFRRVHVFPRPGVETRSAWPYDPVTRYGRTDGPYREPRVFKFTTCNRVLLEKCMP